MIGSLLASLKALQRHRALSAAGMHCCLHTTSRLASSSRRNTSRWDLVLPGLAWALGGVLGVSLAEEQAGPPAANVPSNDSTAKWRIYTDQGAALSSKGDYKRAEGYLQRALAEAQQGFGPADPHVAAACQNLAELYRLQLKFDQAGPLYEKAIEGLQRSYGELDARTAEAMHNAAGFHAESGDAQRAQRCYQRAIDAKRAALGPAHPAVCASLVPLAWLVAKQGDLQRGAALLEQQLQYLDGQGQEASAGARMLLQPLAQLRRQQGNREAALKLLRRLYQAERASDPRSPAAEGAATDLARALQELGEYDEARALLDEKLSLLSQSERHMTVTTTTHKLVQLELAVGTPDSLLRAHNLAAGCCQQVSDMWREFEDQLRPRHGWFAKEVPADQQQQVLRRTPVTAACLVRSFDHLATAQQRLGRNREALATLAAALDIFESDLLDPALEHARKTENPRDAGTAQKLITAAFSGLQYNISEYRHLLEKQSLESDASRAQNDESLEGLRRLMLRIARSPCLRKYKHLSEADMANEQRQERGTGAKS